ncbi:HNH endonuclease family protein [Oerskovia sp. M15]
MRAASGPCALVPLMATNLAVVPGHSRRLAECTEFSLEMSFSAGVRVREGRPLSSTSPKSQKSARMRRVLRITLIALALGIVIANAVNQQTIEAHEAPVPGRPSLPSRRSTSRGGRVDRVRAGELRLGMGRRGQERVRHPQRHPRPRPPGPHVLDPGQGLRGAYRHLRRPYTGETINFTRGNGTSAAVQIDHVIPLLDAWRKGAQSWDAETRLRFANDPLNLLASDGSANQSKGARDASAWLPPNNAFRCTYIARQIAVKSAYDLWVTPLSTSPWPRSSTDARQNTCPPRPDHHPSDERRGSCTARTGTSGDHRPRPARCESRTGRLTRGDPPGPAAPQGAPRRSAPATRPSDRRRAPGRGRAGCGRSGCPPGRRTRR